MNKDAKPRAKFGPTTEETLEQLARIACSLHGMKADGPLILRLGDDVIYDGIAWQSPEIMEKAKIAFGALLPDALSKFRVPEPIDAIVGRQGNHEAAALPHQSAYREGWLAGLAGRPQTPNPYANDHDKGSAWMTGWDRGSSGQEYDIGG